MRRFGFITTLMIGIVVPFCDAQLVIDSLDGDVTQNEVDTFLTVVSATPIPTSQWSATVTHNYLADGTGGTTLEAINDVYAVTGDIPSLNVEHKQLLDLSIRWTDAWLIHRNDLPLGEQRVMWTGNVEPIWPPNCPTCSGATYYESEVGDTVGHIGYTAYNILNTPAIWNDKIPDGDANHFGTTYLARAMTYVSMLEFTMSNSFTANFIDPNSLLISRPSTSQGYLSSFHNVNAWNVQMMLLNAYWRLAQCHQILGDNPALVAMYRSIVQNSTDMFVQNAVPSSAPDGTPVYDWGYGNFGDVLGRLTGEQIGVHGQYDMWGLTRAYRTGDTAATAQQMQTYADTVVHEITLQVDPLSGAATYASYNDRCCSTQTYNYLPTGFIFLTPYNTDIYRPAANAAISSGRQKNSPGLTSNILWAKHWIFTHSSPADFSISAAPDSQAVTAGASTSFTVTLTPSGGFNDSVSLSVDGLPDGATASFNPTSIPGGQGSSILTVITINTAASTYSITITATDASGSPSHTAQVALGVSPPASQWVSVDSSGNLVYTTLPQGDHIMDFSWAGYMGGGVSLPEVPVATTVSPSGGDDSSAIQSALDLVASLIPDGNGFRGAVLLAPGTFNISSTLNMNASGLVLRGSGSASNGTVINMYGSAGFLAVSMKGSGSYSTDSTANIIDSYVPSGTNTITVDDASGFNVSNNVLIRRPATADWIHLLGMDTLVRDGQPQTWLTVGSAITTDRVIQAISGNTITLDAPLTDSFDSTYLGSPVGTISNYAFPGRISQDGLEHLTIQAPAGTTIYSAVTMDNIIDSWIQDVAGQETQNAFNVNKNAKRITLDHVINNVTTTQTRAAGTADFAITGTQTFINQCQSNGTGDWPLVTQATGTGPIAILNFSSTQGAGISPHQRWTTGVLTDNATIPNAPQSTPGIAYRNRGTAGSGQGWTTGWSVAWNSTSPWFLVSAAPGTENWCIGCVGSKTSTSDPDGIFDSLGAAVSPPSLYLAQLCQRLGPAALANIGYSSGFCASPQPTSSPAQISK